MVSTPPGRDILHPPVTHGKRVGHPIFVNPTLSQTMEKEWGTRTDGYPNLITPNRSL